MNSRYTRLYAGLLACGLAFTGATASAANQGDWIFKIGASTVSPDGSSDAVPGIPGSGVEPSDATTLSFTIAKMVSPNVAIELLGALPFQHDIDGTDSISGLGTVAETKQLPPTLSVQYYFNPQAKVRPFVGVGLNYTTFFDTNTKGALSGLDIDLDDSWGLAGQLGVEFDLGNNWFINADARYVDINTTATIESIGSFDVQIDPWVFTLSAGTTF
jgi:outer membrane protein